MTVEELVKIMEDEGEKYQSLREHGRKDLLAFNMLDKLVPGTKNIIGSAEHDVIYIDIDIEDLADVIIEEDARELVRCGVLFFEEYESLGMFV